VLDRVDRAIANVPTEDEETSEAENHAVAATKAWLKDHAPIPKAAVLAEFGLTAEDFKGMGQARPILTSPVPDPEHLRESIS